MIVHFSAHISKWELVCKFGVIFHIFIISCLCSRFHVWNQWFFYFVITFSYTKCFVHSYTVDVVFTLSYWTQRTPKCHWSLGVYSTKCHMFKFLNKSLWLQVPCRLFRDYEYLKWWWRGPTLYHVKQWVTASTLTLVIIASGMTWCHHPTSHYLLVLPEPMLTQIYATTWRYWAGWVILKCMTPACLHIWGRDKMVATLQTTCSNTFSWKRFINFD